MVPLLTSEEWRPIDGWPYEVSNLGRVRRTMRYRNSKPDGVLSNYIANNGYARVSLSDVALGRRNFHVHVLVAAAFLGPRPSERHLIAHFDGDRGNARADNLRRVTWKHI